MQKLAVVYFLQTHTDEINQLREQYDPGWKIIPPHITIVSPLSEVTERQLIEHIESAIKDIRPFSILLSGLIRTSDRHLFLQVTEGAEKIITLHDTLYSGILTAYLPTEYPFEPHITLGFFGDKDDAVFDKAYGEAEKINLHIAVQFDSLVLIKGDGISPAKVIKSFPLIDL